MDRTQRAQAIDELKGSMSKVASVVIADFRGMTVDSVTSLRRDFRAAQCEYKVVKNTLLGLAVRGTRMEGIEPLLVGPTAIAWSYEDPAAPAKVATKWARDEKKFVIKGGYVDGQVLDLPGVQSLANLPGKDELRSMLLATMLAVPQTFVRLLIAAPQSFVHLLDAQERKLRGAEGQP